MTSVRPVPLVSYRCGGRQLQANSNLRRGEGHGDTKCEIICLRSSRAYFDNFSSKPILPRRHAGKHVIWNFHKKTNFLRLTHASRGERTRSLTQQDANYGRSSRFVYENPRCNCFLTTLASPSASRTRNFCGAQSIEGAEISSIQNGSREHQKRLEVSTDSPKGGGEDQQLREHEVHETSSSNVIESWPSEQVQLSDEKRILEPEEDDLSGDPRNGERRRGTQIQESNEVQDNRTARTILAQDFDTEPDWEEDVEYVTRISVPREKYIPVPKVDLVNALILLSFPANKDASKFLSICSYLELILHAEHKVVLEELRSDYTLAHYVQDADNPDNIKVTTTSATTNTSKLGSASTELAQKHAAVGELGDWPPDHSRGVADGFRKGLTHSPWKVLTDLGITFMASFKQQGDRDADSVDADGDPQKCGLEGEREAASERFQKNFLKMLSHAEFEGISVRDMELTAALNSDYLLTLPVDVDWKRTSSANVRIFRRGYTKEEQTGLLLGSKLDYLQSLFFRTMFKGFTGPLLFVGRWCIQKWNSLWEDEERRTLAEFVSRWLQEPLVSDSQGPSEGAEQGPEHKAGVPDREAELDIPIWMAARQVVPRYEAVLSSAGSRGLLIRGILVRMGLLQSESPMPTLLMDEDENALEPHLRPTHLSRVSMKDIWLSASKAVVERNPWTILRATFSIFFSKATLQEPAFEHLVLLYNADCHGDSQRTRLQLQTYKKIPLPDLKIVFPSKKLIFRILDTVRLDITSILGLLAFTVNYHFDDLSSPSAFLLDLIAISALVVFITRVGFGYKQVWDRYQLLVNKTLYEKTVASGFGVVQFLLDESEEQRFKEAILVLLLLMHHGKDEGMTIKQLTNACEQFLYYRCKAKVDMPVERAIKTLQMFGLIAVSEEISHNTDVHFRALPSDQGLRALEQHWVSLPSSMSIWV